MQLESGHVLLVFKTLNRLLQGSFLFRLPSVLGLYLSSLAQNTVVRLSFPCFTLYTRSLRALQHPLNIRRMTEGQKKMKPSYLSWLLRVRVLEIMVCHYFGFTLLLGQSTSHTWFDTRNILRLSEIPVVSLGLQDVVIPLNNLLLDSTVHCNPPSNKRQTQQVHTTEVF